MEDDGGTEREGREGERVGTESRCRENAQVRAGLVAAVSYIFTCVCVCCCCCCWWCVCVCVCAEIH